jgi:hypothetical protein
VKFPNGVILDETVPDQVKFHCAISVGIKVLAALTRTDGDFFLETQTMPLGNGNKLYHMFQKSGVHPRCLIHPFPVHDLLHLAETQTTKMAYIST